MILTRLGIELLDWEKFKLLALNYRKSCLKICQFKILRKNLHISKICVYPIQDYMFIPLLMDSPDYAIFNFYVISVVQILLPFILLSSLNFVIIMLTKKKLYEHLAARHALPDMPKIAKLLRKGRKNGKLKFTLKKQVLIFQKPNFRIAKKQS